MAPAEPPPDDVAFRDDVPPPAPDVPVERDAVPPPPRRTSRLPSIRLPHVTLPPVVARFGAPVLLALVLVAGVVGIVKREAVVRIAPQTAKVFAAIRMPVNLRGLVFRDVRSETVWEGTTRYLVVEGEVANVTDRTVPVASILLTVRGAEGDSLYTWTVEPMRPRLDAGQAMAFRARLASPPADGQKVVVMFAKDGGTTQANASPR